VFKAARRFLVFGVFIICVHAVLAQNQPHPPRFALEISSSGKLDPYSIVPEQGESSTLKMGSAMYSEQSTAKAPASRPSAVKLTYKVEKDVVALTVSVFFGSFNANDTPRSLQGIPEKIVGTFSLRLNDTILLRELEPLGLRPLTVKVVSTVAQAPVSAHILSSAPSIHLEMVSQDRTGYRVAIHNDSSRAVVQYAVAHSIVPDSGGGLIASSYGMIHPLIAPGSTREEPVFCNQAVDPRPCDFVLQTAVFEDGSYEGDANMAAVLEIRRLARDLQSRRVQEIIKSNSKSKITGDTVSSEHRNLGATVVRTREQLASLPDEPDDATTQTIFEKIRSDFPGFGESNTLRAMTVNATVSELRGVKQSALRSLNDYEAYCQSFEEHPSASHSSKMSLSEWVAMGSTMGVRVTQK
jgi:hypothetical protein